MTLETHVGKLGINYWNLFVENQFHKIGWFWRQEYDRVCTCCIDHSGSPWITVDLQIYLVRLCPGTWKRFWAISLPIPTWEAHHWESSLSTGRTIGWLAAVIWICSVYVLILVYTCIFLCYLSTSLNQSVLPLFLSGWYFSASFLYARLGGRGVKLSNYLNISQHRLQKFSLPQMITDGCHDFIRGLT